MPFGRAINTVWKTGKKAEEMVSYMLWRTCSFVERDAEDGYEQSWLYTT
jgi:hypothetical protein